MHRLSLIFLLFCLLCAGCRKSHKPKIAWYYWSSYLYTSDFREFSKIHKVDKLYLRLFDVKWHALYGAYPEADFRGDLRNDSSFSEVVPVIYITNESLINTPDDSIPALHRKMKIEIETHLKNQFGFQTVREWQFDCDWTNKSREKYFHLLRLFGESENLTISATVKLWQYAYREKAGIPPCDRAVLMCYNIANPRETRVENSIFEADEVKKYLKKKDYPLPLDIALPCFGWGVWFRNGEFKGLISELDSINMASLPVTQTKPNHYTFKREIEVYGRFFMDGDEIRLEAAGPDEFLTLAEELSKHFNDSKSTLILYNFEQFNEGSYANDSLFVDRLLRHF